MKVITEHAAVDLLDAVLNEMGPIRVLEHIASYISVHGVESQPQPGSDPFEVPPTPGLIRSDRPHGVTINEGRLAGETQGTWSPPTGHNPSCLCARCVA